MVGVTLDITERKRAEEALIEADQRKDEFLATLAHELRNPLAPLRNAVHVLRAAGKQAQAGLIHDMIERQVNHLARLVDDLLEMSRISRGALELRRESVELEAIVRNAVETSDPLIKAGGHRLKIALPDEPLVVHGDPVRLAQIVANLLNNAAKYSDKASDIALEVRREGREALIRVRDNGIGIDARLLPRLFEMFSRGEGAGRSGKDGLGIGLALARKLAELHGGSIEAKSEGRGKGSEFTVHLPAASLPAVDSARISAHTQTAPLAAPRVLVVDDNRDAADSLGIVLKLLGAEVYVVGDGPGALAALDGFRPRIVLLDIGMPGMDGYEVARRMRQHPSGNRMAIVALSGWGQDEDRKRSREAGFDHHLVKPADIDALHALMASIQAQGQVTRLQ